MVSIKLVFAAATVALSMFAWTPSGVGAAGQMSQPAGTRTLTYGHVMHGGESADMLCDRTSGGCAYVTTYQFGTSDTCGAHAGAGHWFLFVWTEQQDARASGRLSSEADFGLRDSRGTQYSPRVTCTNDSGGRFLTALALTDASLANSGWVEFQIPAHRDSYRLLWNESGLIRARAMSSVRVAGNPVDTARGYA